MGKHSSVVVPLTPANPVGVSRRRPHVRSRVSLVLFSFTAAIGFLLVNVVDPYAGATASPTFNVADRFAGQDAQTLVVTGAVDKQTITRDKYTVKSAPKPKPVVTSSRSSGGAPAVGAPDPGSAQAYAHDLLASRGMGEDQYACLVALWNRESHWNVYAYNASSGAYGIPQAVPGGKMVSAGADWKTSYKTQVNWGVGYVTNRYGNPCGAWAHSESAGWY